MRAKFILIVSLISGSCLAQQATPLLATVPTDYLKTSRHQRTWATVFMCTGIPVLGTGYLFSGISHAANSIDRATGWPIQDKRRSFTGVKCIGAALLLGSIALYSTAAKNKKRAFATSASFKLESDPMIKKTGIYESFPALAVTLRL